jgi:hypothetical protein
MASHSGVLDLWMGIETFIPDIIKENDPYGYGPPYTYDPITAWGSTTALFYMMCGAFSPNFNNQPYLVDFILDPYANIDPMVWAKWELHDPLYLATFFPLDANLSIYLDCGKQDLLYPESVSMSNKLTNLGIPHTFLSYEGNHTNKMKERIPISLTFLDSAVKDTTLSVDTDTLSASTGGKADFYLTAGWDNANRNYIILGTVSGTTPGTPLPGGMATLPLNWDILTGLVINLLNTPIFSNFMGTLDATGSASAKFDTIAPIPGAAGLTLHFAFALNNPWDFASNPVGIEIVP